MSKAILNNPFKFILTIILILLSLAAWSSVLTNLFSGNFSIEFFVSILLGILFTAAAYLRIKFFLTAAKIK